MKKRNQFRDISNLAYGGALANSATGVMNHPENASQGIGGAFGIGIMSATSGAMFDLIEGKRKRRR